MSFLVSAPVVHSVHYLSNSARLPSSVCWHHRLLTSCAVRISYASFDPLMMATPDGAERCLILSADSMELQSSFHEDGDDEQLAPSSAFVTPHATPKKDGSSSEPSSSYRARRPDSSLHTACMSSRLRVNPRVRGGMMSGKVRTTRRKRGMGRRRSSSRNDCMPLNVLFHDRSWGCDVG